METLNISSKIYEKKVFENGRIFIAPTGARNIVSFEGSVFGGSNFLPDLLNKVPSFTTQLFDTGTKTKDKETIRDSLAARGASLGFSSGGDRTYFSGSCLPEDLNFVLSLAAECMADAVFPAKEIPLVKERRLGSLKEGKTETRTQAREELSRMLFDPAHVNYIEKDAATEKRINLVTRKHLIDFKNTLGRGGLVLAIVGDVTEASALKSAERAFGSLKAGLTEAPSKSKNKKVQALQDKIVTIPEKANIDLFLGVALPIDFTDEAFIPLTVLADMLGGGFGGHLMQTVRERDGLTYGISSAMDGFGIGIEGYFRIWSTLSPLLYEKGLETIRKEVKNFFKNGITEDASESKKDEILGTYLVSLSTTRGLASKLHAIGRDAKQLSYIDEYSEIIRKMKLDQIRAAAGLIPLDKLSLSAAGTFLKK
jgi:zinc protease